MKPTIRVLIVDENAEDRTAVMGLLAHDDAHHHLVEEAASGEAALAACRRVPFDVVLLDQSLPRMNGATVLQAVRALPHWSGAVVACTSTHEPEVARRAFEEGATDLLNKKNVSPSLLSSTVENALIKRRCEVQVQAAQRRIAQLHMLAEGLSRVASTKQMGPLIVEQTVRVLGADAGYLAMVTEDERHFRFEASVNLNAADARSGRKFRHDEPLPVAACLRTGTLLAFANVEGRERQFPALIPLLREFEGFVVVPLPGMTRMIGALGILFREARVFSEEKQEFLKLVGKLCGQALERAALYDEAQKAHQAAALNAERYRALVSASAQIVWRSAPSGEVTTISGNWTELTGRAVADATGAGWSTTLHPDDRQAFLSARARGFSQGVPFAAEVRLRSREGQYRWFSVQAAPVRDETGEIREWIGAASDFTARKESEEALRKERENYRLSTERFEVALRSSQVVVFNQDLDLRYTWIHNPALGFTPQTVIGKRDLELFERASDAEVTERLKGEVLRTGRSHRQEVVVQDQGEARHYDLRVEPLLDASRNIIGVTCAAVDVTERKQLENKLLAREQELWLALTASSTGIWSWNLATDQVDWSAECFKIHGLTPREFDGTGAHFFRMVHPDDLGRVEVAVRAAMADEALFQCEFRVVRPDGSIVWVENVGRLEKSGSGARLVGTITDITPRRLATEALRTSEERLARAQRAAQVGTWDWNVNTNQFFWTEEARGLFHQRRSEAAITYEIGLNAVHPDDRLVAAADAKRGLETGHYSSMFRVLCEDGSVRWLKSEGSAVIEGGKATRLLGTVRDITEQRLAEAEAQEALERAKQAVRARDQLVALVSHDLKNPLGAMSIGVDFLRRQIEGEGQMPPREKIVTTLQRLWRQVRRMDRLLDELIDVARLHAGRALDLNPQQIDLAVLVRNMVEEHEQISPDHHFEVSVGEQSVIGAWDPKRLERVINNLLSNAIKYSPGGGAVRIELERVSEGAVLRVKDAGVGIPAADLSKIFDWYTRGGNELHQTIHGAGIGLAGARQIVTEHGGSISVESEVAKGSTFTVRLPAGFAVR